MERKKNADPVTQYLRALSPAARSKMLEMRRIIQKAAPPAEEVISYRMPAFKLNGMLVWYAPFKTHLGFYPKGSGIAAFKKELASYEGSKGTVRFPLDKPLPAGLISRIVKFRVKENRDRALAKGERSKRGGSK